MTLPQITIYYHDPVEVDPRTGWTGLSPILEEAQRIHIKDASSNEVTRLFDYAQPDAVITVDEHPVLSIEQTQMNPSGHNIPQRFSFHVRAAELGVPSILYYPEYSRRTFSDPNVRYLQVRVPLAQLRLTKIYSIPALSVFWPTDRTTKLPDMHRESHQAMSEIVTAIVSNAPNSINLTQLPVVTAALSRMESVITKYERDYDRNTSVRHLLPQGFPHARTSNGVSIDPPSAAKLLKTEDFLSSLDFSSAGSSWGEVRSSMRSRPLTLLFTGTANAKGNDSEHPWPGYLTLLDTLYLREGKTTRERVANLVYRLPVPLETFVSRAGQANPPTPTYIADTFCDMILLDGGAVAGRPMRGNAEIEPCLQ